MEEAELLKERLQAITNKKKIQEEIAQKRLEIDREKLKLQHVKKRSMRDLWLLDGVNSNTTQETQKALEDAQQTKLLKSNIHRIEKEIEALEREEMNISTNEGLILKRLKAIEKSPEEIIKAVNADFISEQIQIDSTIPNMLKPKTPLINQRKKLDLDAEAKNDQAKPAALLAMEINVQKDLRTGESQVISTSTISPQELQQRGIKVYDDGRKTVYALRTDGSQAGANGVDELSPVEVEELIRQASEKKKRSNRVQAVASHPYSLSHELQAPSKPLRERHQLNGYQDPYSVDLSAWPELIYSDSVHYPEDHRVPLLPMPNYTDRSGEYFHNSKDNSYNYELNRKEICEFGQYRDPRENHGRTLNSDIKNHRADSACSGDSKLSTLNAVPSDEPITMIFMGYQNAEEDSQDYEGSVRAELVIIGEGEDDTSRDSNDTQNSNVNNACLDGWKGDGTENPSATELHIRMKKLGQTV